MIKRAIVIFTVLLFLFGCREKGVEEIKKEVLFSLEFGKLENQIDLFQLKGRVFNSKNRVFMRDGIFYIANGNSNKIMEFSSYGDLLFLLYNPKINPEPFMLKREINPNERTTKFAVPFDLEGIGDIVVDSRNDIYVENKIGRDRWVKDKKKGIILNRVVSHFKKNGEFINFLGQEGIGGTPFPFIEDLFLVNENEPVVVTRDPLNWEVFWFYDSGDLRYHVVLNENSFREKAESDVKYEIEKVVPDCSNFKLYIVVSSYRDIIDPSTKVRSGIERRGASIYEFDLVNQHMKSLIVVPTSGVKKEKIGEKEVEIPAPSYEFFGITNDRIFFFLKYDDLNRYTLLTIDEKGETVEKRVIILDDSQLAFKYLRLSPEGIIYGLIADEKKASVVWWRSDKILKKYREMRDEERKPD